MKSIFESRNKFNQLVKSLRDDQVLDEDNLKEVLSYRKKHSYFVLLFSVVCIFPILGAILLILWGCIQAGFGECIVHPVSSTALLLIFMFLGAIILILKIEKDFRDTEVFRVGIFSCGIYTKGEVISFKDSLYDKCVMYKYRDVSGRSFRGKVVLPHKTFREHYSEGDAIRLVYSENEPSSSLIIIPELEIYNIKKRC